MRNFIEEELKLEGYMWEYGEHRNVRSPFLLRKKNILISTYINPLLNAFENWLKELVENPRSPVSVFGNLVPVFKNLSRSQIITLITIALDTLFNKVDSTKTGLVFEMGTNLYYQLGLFNMPDKQWKVLWEYSKKYKPHIVRRIIKENIKPYLVDMDIDKTMVFQLGLRFYALLKAAGLIHEYCITRSKKTITYVGIPQKILEYLKQYDYIKPLYKPMVVEPLAWSITDGRPEKGGYFVLPLQLIHGQKFRANVHQGIWLDCLNKLQKIPYRISPEMLEFFEWCLENEILVEPKPSKFQKPEKPVNATKEELKAFKYKMREYHANVAHSEGLWIAYVFTRNIAREMKNYERIYFPMYLDFRGRMYYAPAYVQPQSADYAKSLLEFAQKRQIKTDEGWKWFKIGIANAFGKDKLRYTERLSWFEENEDLILEVGKHPYRMLDVIQEADKPFQFVHLCKEYVKAQKGEPTGVIIQIDGSNNGTQHLSAFQRWNNKYVNMTSEDKFYDLYAIVAEKVNELLYADKDIHNLQFKLFWMEKGVDRSFVKRNVMTYPYSVTYPGMVEQNLAYIMKHFGLGYFGNLPVFDTLNYITRLIAQALKEIVPLDVLHWLQEVVKIINQPLSWVTPSGFEVNQAYWKTIRKELRTIFGKQRIKIYIRRDTNNLAYRKMRLAVSPNFVHSYDAAHLVLIAQRFDDALLVQHDSFGTYPDKVEELQRIIRETFVELYSQNVLEKHKYEWERKYGVKLPDPPVKNEWEPEEILKAPYFFS